MATTAMWAALPRPSMIASQSRTNQTGGHQASAVGCRPMSGRTPSVAINTVPCMNKETRAKIRLGMRFSRTPWQASRLKNTKAHAPLVATKFAPTVATADGFPCQCPEVQAAKTIAQGRVIASRKATKTRSNEPNFAKKIWRSDMGNPASARQSRRLGNSDSHVRAVRSRVMPMPSAMNDNSSARISR